VLRSKRKVTKKWVGIKKGKKGRKGYGELTNLGKLAGPEFVSNGEGLENLLRHKRKGFALKEINATQQKKGGPVRGKHQSGRNRSQS